jgi:hypothetical protein
LAHIRDLLGATIQTTSLTVIAKDFRIREETMIRCEGYENGRFLIRETQPGLRLDFQGPDAKFFTQVDAPENPEKTVGFEPTVQYVDQEFPGFLPIPPGA